MTDYREHSGETLRSAQGFSLLEIMTVVAILGILATFAIRAPGVCWTGRKPRPARRRLRAA